MHPDLARRSARMILREIPLATDAQSALASRQVFDASVHAAAKRMSPKSFVDHVTRELSARLICRPRIVKVRGGFDLFTETWGYVRLDLSETTDFNLEEEVVVLARTGRRIVHKKNRVDITDHVANDLVILGKHAIKRLFERGAAGDFGQEAIDLGKHFVVSTARRSFVICEAMRSIRALTERNWTSRAITPVNGGAFFGYVAMLDEQLTPLAVAADACVISLRTFIHHEGMSERRRHVTEIRRALHEEISASVGARREDALRRFCRAHVSHTPMFRLENMSDEPTIRLRVNPAVFSDERDRRPPRLHSVERKLLSPTMLAGRKASEISAVTP